MLTNSRDRVQQVNSLIELAGDIVTYAGATLPEEAIEAVAFWLDTEDSDEVLPSWFDAHDRYLLEEFVSDLLRPEEERVRL